MVTQARSEATDKNSLEHLASVVRLSLPERRAVSCWDCRAVFGDPHEAVDHAIHLGHQVHIDYTPDWQANP